MRGYATAGLVLLAMASALAGARADDVSAVIQEMFKGASGEWAARIEPDATQMACSGDSGGSAPDTGEIVAREKASVRYPTDGIVLGDWKRGEVLAQTGTGGQFTDKPEVPHGPNCYACHQIAPSELSYGTLGPSLQGYGKLKGFTGGAARDVYTKIYNSNAFVACSKMPRFGVHGFLTMAQIKDLTAYLMSPESPVNK